MRKLTLTSFQSLDGVVQGPGFPDEDRDGGFELGGWQMPYVDDDMVRVIVEQFGRAGGFLFGRRTYEIFAAHWPKVTDPDDQIAAALNRLPKHVASRTLDRADWEHTTVLSGDLVEAVTELKRQPGGELQVHGSGGLAQTLMAHDLVDEYHLWSFPVVLGSGKRLFREGRAPVSLKLQRTETTGAGAVMTAYQPAVGQRTAGAGQNRSSSTAA